MTDNRIKEACPFCGCEASKIEIREFHKGENKIYCPICRATFDYIGSKQEVIDKWNGRYR